MSSAGGGKTPVPNLVAAVAATFCKAAVAATFLVVPPVLFIAAVATIFFCTAGGGARGAAMGQGGRAITRRGGGGGARDEYIGGGMAAALRASLGSEKATGATLRADTHVQNTLRFYVVTVLQVHIYHVHQERRRAKLSLAQLSPRS